MQGCQKVRKSQEKLKTMTKVRKSLEKIGVFEKKSGNLTKKKTDIVSLNLQSSSILKPSNGKKKKNFQVRKKFQNFPRNLQNYLISNVFIW